ncbi:MAG: phage tail protein, partial [Thermoflexales bacterium]|nr:phage tail protein [Thermoflexales bacterium]
MAEFTVNTHRFDPYKNFKFRVKWDGRYIPGIQRVSPLRRSAAPIFRRDGDDSNTSRVSPGTWVFEPLTLERGVTHDPSFEEWANKALQYGAGHGAEMSLKSFRKDII